MKNLEEFIAMERYKSDSRDNAGRKRLADRSLTREQRKQKRCRTAYIAVVVVWAAIIAALLAVPGLVSKSKAVDTPEPTKPAEATTDPIVEANRQAQEHMLRESALVSKELQEQFRAEIEQEEATPMDDAITMLAKVIWGEARGCTTTEQAAVVWTVLNRVDHPDFGDDIEEVVLRPNAFTGYDPSNPVLEEHMRLAEDVIERWTWEKWDGGDYGRVLPKAYLYFHGDGKINWFRMEYEHTGEYWDWSFESPYEEG